MAAMIRSHPRPLDPRNQMAGKLVYLNCALAREPVGLAEDAAGWTVSFGPVAHRRPPDHDPGAAG